MVRLYRPGGIRGPNGRARIPSQFHGPVLPARFPREGSAGEIMQSTSRINNFNLRALSGSNAWLTSTGLDSIIMIVGVGTVARVNAEMVA